MSLPDSINGTDVKMRIYDPDNDEWHFITGETTSALTLTNTPIDVTVKQSNSNRCIMELEGLQTADVSLEVIFNSDEGFQFAKASFLSKAIRKFESTDGLSVFPFMAYIPSFSESSPDNDKLTASISLMSSNDFDESFPVSKFFSFDSVNFYTSNNERFYVRD